MFDGKYVELQFFWVFLYESVIAQELKDFGRLSGRLVAYCDLDQTQRGRG
jgi:hypothetical protein